MLAGEEQQRPVRRGVVVPGPALVDQRRLADAAGHVVIDDALDVTLELLEGQNPEGLALDQSAQQFHLLKVDTWMAVAFAVEHDVEVRQRIRDLSEVRHTRGGSTVAGQHECRVVEILKRPIELIAPAGFAKCGAAPRRPCLGARRLQSARTQEGARNKHGAGQHQLPERFLRHPSMIARLGGWRRTSLGRGRWAVRRSASRRAVVSTRAHGLVVMACPDAGAVCTTGGNVITCNLNDLAVATSVAVTVNATAAAAGAQSSVAAVATSATDQVSANNSATTSTTVSTVPPVTPAPATSKGGGGGLTPYDALGLAIRAAMQVRRPQRRIWLRATPRGAPGSAVRPPRRRIP